MILSFGDAATEDFFHGRFTKRAAKFKNLERVARRKLDILNAAKNLSDLAGSPGNQLEALKRDLNGYHSIRVNEQWRVIFIWQEGNASLVEIRDYH